MVNSIFYISFAVSFCFLIFKFIEMKFIVKENVPVKLLARDTLLVYLSVLLGNFVYSQIGGLDNLVGKVPEVFTNSPEF
jgi:hypothetical protein